MLNFLKSNNPAVIAFYFFYLVLFRVSAFFIPVNSGFAFSHREPLSHFVFGLLKNPLQNHMATTFLLSGLLCFIQALLLNRLVNENKILPRKNYLSGAIFLILVPFFKESLVLSPALLALTFLIIATLKLFSLIHKEKASGDIFDVGFLVAVSMLFYFPCLLLVIFAFIGLSTLRPFVYKEWIILIAGFISPFILVFTYYIWFNKASLLLPDIINMHGNGWMSDLTFTRLDWWLTGGLVLITFAAFSLLPAALFSSLIQVRKFSTILIFLTLLVVLSFLLQQTVNISHWALLALPLSVIFSMSLMQIKRKWLQEVIHLILILLVLAGQYLPLLNIS